MYNVNELKTYFDINGYVILKDFLSSKDINNLKEMMINGYKNHLDNDISIDNISNKIVHYEKKGMYDKLYDAFKAINSSNCFQNIDQKLSDFVEKTFNFKTKLINTGYAIGIKDSIRTSYDWHQGCIY